MLESVIKIAKQAGEEILKVYNSPEIEVLSKEDKSPLTQADLAANKVIEAGLQGLDSSIPILSEESAQAPYEERKTWTKFWLVDPLDGTKDFIARNGQFTVNIALIENCFPTMGVIHIPAEGKTYWAQKGSGSFRDGEPISNTRTNTSNFVAADSNFHSNDNIQQFFKINGVTDSQGIGSSIKFCALAEGRIDVYPRLAPTSEWDTGAGQIIVEEAGGEVIDLTTGKSLRYNKESILNPHFLLTRRGLEWKLP